MEMTRVKHGVSASNIHLNGRRHCPRKRNSRAVRSAEPRMLLLAFSVSITASTRVRTQPYDFASRMIDMAYVTRLYSTATVH
jgi:hypothetical protein